MTTIPNLQQASVLSADDLLLVRKAGDTQDKNATVSQLEQFFIPRFQPLSANLTLFSLLTFLDEGTMSSNSTTAVPSQKSVKTYTDNAASVVANQITALETIVDDLLPIDAAQIDSGSAPAGYILSADGAGGTTWQARLSVGVWETGDTCRSYRTSKDGWLLVDGRTVGNASSNATSRANSDCEDLFSLLWENLSDTTAPLFTSAGAPAIRGASAAADWAANRQISLPDERGRAEFGRDNMGGAVAGRLTSAINGTILGAVGGTETHTLTEAEMPAHSHNPGSLATSSAGSHSHTINSDGAHTHTVTSVTGTSTTSNQNLARGNTSSPSTATTSSSGAHTHTMGSAGAPTHSTTGTTALTGSGRGHNNILRGIA